MNLLYTETTPPPFTASWNWDTSCRFNLLHTVSRLSGENRNGEKMQLTMSNISSDVLELLLELFTPAPSLLTRPTPRPYWRRPTSSSSTLSAKSVSPFLGKKLDRWNVSPDISPNCASNSVAKLYAFNTTLYALVSFSDKLLRKLFPSSLVRERIKKQSCKTAFGASNLE